MANPVPATNRAGAINPDGRPSSPYPVKAMTEPSTTATSLEDFAQREPEVVAVAETVNLEEVDRGNSAI